MALPQQSTHVAGPAGDTIEPDTGGATDDTWQYWYRTRPGGGWMAPPLAPYSEHHGALADSQPPFPVLFSPQGLGGDAGPIKPPPASGKHCQAALAAETPQNTAQAPRPNAAAGQRQSPEPPMPRQNCCSAAEQQQERKRCEVWPLTYRTAHGWAKTLWYVHVEGESICQSQQPDFEALSRRYHLVYFPELT